MKKAIFRGPRDIAVVDADEPELVEGEAIIDVLS